MRHEISYGKEEVTLYRTYARALEGLTPIAESPFRGRSNTLFGADVDVQVLDDNFLPSYTEGDNTNVVATDSMKNFVLRKGLEFEGATHEGFLWFLAREFLATYEQINTLRLRAHEIAFEPLSGVLFSRRHDNRGWAELLVNRDGILEHQSGRTDLQLIKTTGSSFTRFVRDEHTTLPEVVDRPLFCWIDVFWRYADPLDAVAEEPSRYVASEQVRDLCAAVFDELNSKSIQQLVWVMGGRILERFPRLAEVSFVAQNRTWDTFFQKEDDPKVRAATDPRPGNGRITLTLAR
jgi:urate oxidase / 2-oxo-4-hydroxy-4-carboxy-5-ureidoimidazoline decarboxylase